MDQQLPIHIRRAGLVRAPQNLVKGGPTIEWIGRETPLGRTETAPETPYERRQRAAAHGRLPATDTTQSAVGRQGRGQPDLAPSICFRISCSAALKRAPALSPRQRNARTARGYQDWGIVTFDPTQSRYRIEWRIEGHPLPTLSSIKSHRFP